MIAEVDPNHPTCVVTAGFDPEECRLIKANAPDIDIYGINTYGDVGSIAKRVREAGWEGPYAITEWGPNGHWEVARTVWNVPIEQTSAEKSNSYKERYQHIYGDKEKCVGSYVFLWGQKQETTHSWYGLFTKDGRPTAIIDVLNYSWKEKWPENKAPVLKSFVLDGQKATDNIYLTAEDKHAAEVKFEDSESDNITYRWEILPESQDIKSGGDAESRPDALRGLIKGKQSNTIQLRVPKTEGPYRLFVEVDDGNGVAYANIPFYVKPRPADAPPPRKVWLKKYDMDSFNP